MTIFAESSWLGTRTSGRLWWTAHDFHEFVILHMLMPDDAYDDLWLEDVSDLLDSALADWDRGQFTHGDGDETYALTWFDDELSDAVRQRLGVHTNDLWELPGASDQSQSGP